MQEWDNWLVIKWQQCLPPVFILTMEEYNRGIGSDVFMEMAAWVDTNDPVRVISTCFSEAPGIWYGCTSISF